jgi:hypothetical protein
MPLDRCLKCCSSRVAARIELRRVESCAAEQQESVSVRTTGSGLAQTGDELARTSCLPALTLQVTKRMHVTYVRMARQHRDVPQAAHVTDVAGVSKGVFRRGWWGKSTH